VIGGGLRIPPKSLALFEMVVNPDVQLSRRTSISISSM
jgi:hypothetical protein